MRIPSFSSLSPKAVRDRLGNRRRTSSTSSESSSSGYPVTHPNHNIMQDLTLSSAVPHTIQRRPSGLSLYGLYPVSSQPSQIEGDEAYQDGLNVLEPRPKVTHCAGLFELIEDQRFGL